MCHIKYDKLDLHISISQVQKWQNYLELRVWSHEAESVSDSVRGTDYTSDRISNDRDFSICHYVQTGSEVHLAS